MRVLPAGLEDSLTDNDGSSAPLPPHTSSTLSYFVPVCPPKLGPQWPAIPHPRCHSPTSLTVLPCVPAPSGQHSVSQLLFASPQRSVQLTDRRDAPTGVQECRQSHFFPPCRNFHFPLHTPEPPAPCKQIKTSPHILGHPGFLRTCSTCAFFHL